MIIYIIWCIYKETVLEHLKVFEGLLVLCCSHFERWFCVCLFFKFCCSSLCLFLFGGGEGVCVIGLCSLLKCMAYQLQHLIRITQDNTLQTL